MKTTSSSLVTATATFGLPQAEPAPSEAAWAFVVAHEATIRRAARRTWKVGRVEVEDFIQDLMVDVAEKWPTYDPSRSSPSTWIGIRAWKVKDRTIRRLSARPDLDWATRSLSTPATEDAPALDLATEGFGNHETVLVQVTLSQVAAKASPLQREAMVSYLEGWTGDEVKMEMGCTISARNDRLNRLGRRMETTP